MPGARAGGAHAVDAADRLDVDHVGAERGERAGRDRTRPPRGEVEHPHAGQRQLVGTDRRSRAAPGVRFDRAGVLAEARRRARQRRVLVVHAPRATRHLERCRRVVDEHVAGDEVVALEDVLAAVHRRDGDAQLAGQRARSRRSCGAASRRGRCRSTRPSPSGGRVWLLHGSPSMRSGRSMSSEEAVELLAAVGAEADVAVEGRLDRRRLDRAPRADDRRVADAARACSRRSCSRRWSSPRRSRSRCGHRARSAARAGRPRRPPSPRTCPPTTRWCARRPGTARCAPNRDRRDRPTPPAR